MKKRAPDCPVPFTFIGIVHTLRDAESFVGIVKQHPDIPCAMMLRSTEHSPEQVRALCHGVLQMELPVNLTVIPNNLRHKAFGWVHWPASVQPAGSGKYGCWGSSIHTCDELESVQDRGASYGIVSPVFPTNSKPDANPLDPSEISSIVHKSSIPLFALGGIGEPEKVLDVQRMGFAGCVVASLAESRRRSELNLVLNAVGAQRSEE